MGSFQKRELSVVLTLGNGKVFSSSGKNTLRIDGLRISATIEKTGGLAMGKAMVQIFGMPQSDMNELTMIAFHPLEVPDNTMSLIISETNAVVFSGTILSAWADYQNAPDVFLDVSAMTGYFNRIKSAPPTSIDGRIDVATVIESLATKMGYEFENNGVAVTIENHYSGKTAMQQVQDIVETAGIDMYLDDNVLAITNKGVARSTSDIPVIGPQSGLIGYPTFDRLGVKLWCLYRPDIVFGKLIRVESDVPKANGDWRVVSVTHMLESNKPHGQWFSSLFVSDNAVTVV